MPVTRSPEYPAFTRDASPSSASVDVTTAETRASVSRPRRRSPLATAALLATTCAQPVARLGQVVAVGVVDRAAQLVAQAPVEFVGGQRRGRAGAAAVVSAEVGADRVFVRRNVPASTSRPLQLVDVGLGRGRARRAASGSGAPPGRRCARARRRAVRWPAAAAPARRPRAAAAAGSPPSSTTNTFDSPRVRDRMRRSSTTLGASCCNKSAKSVTSAQLRGAPRAQRARAARRRARTRRAGASEGRRACARIAASRPGDCKS